MELERGNRIIFDVLDGVVVAMTGESKGVGILPHKIINSLDYVDVPYGAVDFSKYIIAGVNPTTKELILDAIPEVETDEQRRIRELEDALLLQMDNELGGLL